MASPSSRNELIISCIFIIISCIAICQADKQAWNTVTLKTETTSTQLWNNNKNLKTVQFLKRSNQVMMPFKELSCSDIQFLKGSFYQHLFWIKIRIQCFVVIYNSWKGPIKHVTGFHRMIGLSKSVCSISSFNWISLENKQQ